MNRQFKVKKLNDGITAITAPMLEQIYLIEGADKALVVDSGSGIGSLKRVIDSLTKKPLIVVNTHGHPDHAGGNGEFDRVYLSKEDFALYRNSCSDEARIENLKKIFSEIPRGYEKLVPFVDNVTELVEGQTFDLGGRTVSVIGTSGHTRGSVSFYDLASLSLFCGDTLGKSDSWLYLPESDPLERYFKSLIRLTNLNPFPLRFMTGHLPTPIEPFFLKKKMDCVYRVLNDNSLGNDFTTFAGKGKRYVYHGASIIFNPNKIFEGNDDKS